MEEKIAEKRCENCEFVDRGYDDCSHEVHCISKRCPLHDLIITYLLINNIRIPIELVTGRTSCRFFKIDEEYKKFNEEVDKLNKERNDKHGQD